MSDNTEAIWKEFWMPIVVINGKLDIEQVKKELADYHDILGEVRKVYESVTNGQVSKPNTSADVVIAMNDDIVSKAYDNGYNDCLQDNDIEDVE